MNKDYSYAIHKLLLAHMNGHIHNHHKARNLGTSFISFWFISYFIIFSSIDENLLRTQTPKRSVLPYMYGSFEKTIKQGIKLVLVLEKVALGLDVNKKVRGFFYRKKIALGHLCLIRFLACSRLGERM